MIWTLLGITPFAVFGAAGTVPTSSAGRDQRVAVEQRAIEVALFENALPMGDPHEGEAEMCPRGKMLVSWKAPSAGFEQGGHVEPIGPAPDASTESVNGIVVCEGFTYAYMGFEAYRNGSGWVVVPIPADEHDHMELELPEPEVPLVPDPVPAPAPTNPPAAPKPKPRASTGAAMPSPNLPSEIDGYATYEPQNSCQPSAKPAVSSFRSIVLQQHPATRSAGITRACSIGGQSEHKEGRAWDWWVNVNKPAERASAEHVIGWLLATDSAGHRHAMARRTGVMYIVWNRQIWSTYRANEGWRAYGGPKPHTDHVHFSFSWAGAMGHTSYWSGKAVQTSFTPPDASGSRGGWQGGGSRKSKKTGEQKTKPSFEELKQEWMKRRSKIRESLEEAQADAPEGRNRRRWFRFPEKPEGTSEDPTKPPGDNKVIEAPKDQPADGGQESGDGNAGGSLLPPVTPPAAGSEQMPAAPAPGTQSTSAPEPPSIVPPPVLSENKAVSTPVTEPARSSAGTAEEATRESAQAAKLEDKKRKSRENNSKASRKRQTDRRQKLARQPRKPKQPRKRKERVVRQDRRNSSGEQSSNPAPDQSAGGSMGTGSPTPQKSTAP